MTGNLAALLRVMLVTDDALVPAQEILPVVQAAVRGGVTSIQLRLKQCSARELAEIARAVLAAVDIPLIVNDRLDVAMAVGAAGAHLGPDDLPLRLARRAAPSGFLLGASVGSEAEAVDARGADYWGVGPWASTRTKPDAGMPLGPQGFARLVALGEGIPCVAIGGVRPGDVGPVREAGGAGVAVVSGILGAPDIRAAAEAYASAWAR